MLPVRRIAGTGRDVVGDAGAQIALVVVHGDVGQRVAVRVAVGQRLAAVGVLAAGRQREVVAPVAVGGQDGEGLAAGQRIRIGRVLPRIVVSGRVLEVVASPVQRRAQWRAAGADIGFEQALEPGFAIRAGEGSVDRNQQLALAVDGAETDPVVGAELAEGDRRAGARGEDAAAVVAEPVGEVLRFLRDRAGDAIGPAEAGDLDFRCGDRITLVGPRAADLVLRVVGCTDARTAAAIDVEGDRPEGLVARGKAGVRGLILVRVAGVGEPEGRLRLRGRQIERAARGVGRVVGCRRRRHVAEAHAGMAYPGFVARLRVVEHRVVVRRAAVEIVDVVVLEGRHLRRIVVAAIEPRWRREQVVGEIEVLVRHHLPLHRAGIVEQEHQVGRDRAAHHDGRVGDVDGGAQRLPGQDGQQQRCEESMEGGKRMHGHGR